MSVEAAARRTVGRGVRLHAVAECAVGGVHEVAQLSAERALLKVVQHPLGLGGGLPLAAGERVEVGVMHFVEAEDERNTRVRGTLEAREGFEKATQRAVGARLG